eukprot:gene19911-39463_t
MQHAWCTVVLSGTGMPMDLVIRNASLPDGRRQIDIAVQGERIAAIGERLPVTGAREIDAELQRSVNQVFSQRGIGETRQRGGVLLYVSLFERRVEIRCDRALAATLPPSTLPTIRDAILARLKTGDVAAGLIAGLDEAETALAKAMPATGTPSRQLPDTVLLFHPRPS